MNLNKKYLASVGVGLLAVIIGVFIYTGNVVAPAPASHTAPQTISVSLTVEGLYTAKPVTAVEGQSVLAVLTAINAVDTQLQLSTKEYAGMGVMVEGLHGVANGTGKKYWQYKVNGIMPQLGADKLIVKNGDSIEWYFGESQQ